MQLRLDRDRPLTEQIYAAVRRAIRSGELRPGERVSATREVAARNGVSRNTVVTAWERLVAEGYLEGRGAAGTRVCLDLPPDPRPVARGGRRSGQRRWVPRPGAEGRRMLAHAGLFHPLVRVERDPLPIDFRYNATVSDRTSRAEWGRIVRRVLNRHESNPPTFEFYRRLSPLHRALVRHLRLTRGIECEPEQIFLVPTPQAALAITVRLLVEPGDPVALEDPHYLGARRTLRARGARILRVGVDDAGLRTDRLPEREDVRFAYTTPSHQWPTGAVLPLGRRLDLLRWAAARGACIVENDHNCEYLYGGAPLEAIQGLDDTDRVIYLGSMHRLLRPPLTITFAVVPASLVEGFQAVRALHGQREAPALERDALARYLDEGCVERLVRRAARRMRRKRRVLLDALHDLGREDLHARTSSGGIHVHVVLRGWSAAAVESLRHEADARGVGVYPDRPFWLRPPRDAGLILGFAELSDEEIREGVARVGEAMDSVRPS